MPYSESAGTNRKRCRHTNDRNVRDAATNSAARILTSGRIHHHERENISERQEYLLPSLRRDVWRFYKPSHKDDRFLPVYRVVARIRHQSGVPALIFLRFPRAAEPGKNGYLFRRSIPFCSVTQNSISNVVNQPLVRQLGTGYTFFLSLPPSTLLHMMLPIPYEFSHAVPLPNVPENNSRRSTFSASYLHSATGTSFSTTVRVYLFVTFLK